MPSAPWAAAARPSSAVQEGAPRDSWGGAAQRPGAEGRGLSTLSNLKKKQNKKPQGRAMDTSCKPSSSSGGSALHYEWLTAALHVRQADLAQRRREHSHTRPPSQWVQMHLLTRRPNLGVGTPLQPRENKWALPPGLEKRTIASSQSLSGCVGPRWGPHYPHL